MTIKKIRFWSLIALFSIFVACNNETNTPPNKNDGNSTSVSGIKPPAVIGFAVKNIHPHDTAAFTEGLQVVNGKLLESTGDFNRTFMQMVDIATGKVVRQHKIADPKIFGEGVQLFKGKVYQLTYQNHLVYVYDEKDLSKPIKTFNWPNEGWGMTNDGTNLLVSDGTPNLYTINPEDFRVLKSVQVADNNGPVQYINELEYIDGFVYANVFTQDVILKIDPSSGHVVGKIDCSGLLNQYAAKDIPPSFNKQEHVLNGIAWDSAAKKMYITGKCWPKLFEISLN